MELPISYVTFNFQLPTPVSYRAQIEHLKAQCEAKGVDFARTFTAGLPLILDTMAEQLNALPANTLANDQYVGDNMSPAPVQPPKRRGRKPNAILQSTISDLSPPNAASIAPAAVGNGIDDTDAEPEI